MVLTKEIENTWCPANKKHFENLGYNFTHMKDKFIARFEDVPHGSDKFIDIQCDYCKKIFPKQIKKYYKGRSLIEKDCCMKCRDNKAYEAKIKKYGTVSAYVNGNTVEKHKERYQNGIGKEIFQKIKDIFKERDYILLSEKYINNHTPIKYVCNKHKQCGEQSITWIHLKAGEGCYYCGKESMKAKQSFSYDEVKVKIEENNKNKLLSTEYHGYSAYDLQISCEDCGKPFVTSLGWFLRGKTRCNDCTASVGEKYIIDYLNMNNISYNKEYEICIKEWDNPLYFDFYLKQYSLIIEFDGEQHFHPVDFKGEGIDEAARKFEELQIRDKIKNKYCLENNITLIRIPYWERENIKNVLDDYFINNSRQYVVKDIDHIAIQTAQTA